MELDCWGKRGAGFRGGGGCRAAAGTGGGGAVWVEDVD